MRRPMDQDMLEMLLDSDTEVHIQRRVKPAYSEPKERKAQNCIVQTTKVDSPHSEFYNWLRHSLLTELDEDSSSALIMCVEVLLGDCINNDSVPEALQSVAEMLTESAAPNTALDVAARWYGT